MYIMRLQKMYFLLKNLKKRFNTKKSKINIPTGESTQ